MRGIVYVSSHARPRYNRLYNGPTWGLTRASRQLAAKASREYVSGEEINRILSYYPTLAKRLGSRGFRFCGLGIGATRPELEKLFRNVLYRSHYNWEVSRFGLMEIEKRPSATCPSFIGLSRSLRGLKEDTLTELLGTLAVPLSFGYRLADTFRSTAVTYLAGTLTGAAFGTIAFVLRPVSQLVSYFIDLESESLGVALDTLLPGVAGFALGLYPSRRSAEALPGMRQDLLAGRSWRILKDFESKDETVREPSTPQRVAIILKALDPKTSLKYLSGLKYDRLKALEYIFHDKGLLDQAKVACEDTPPEELHNMLMQAGHEKVADQVFARIKHELNFHELEVLIFLDHFSLETRREAFALAAEEMDEAYLQRQAVRIRNVPALITHPAASPEAKLASVKATIMNEVCPELLGTFAAGASPKDIREIFEYLEGEDSSVAQANLRTLIQEVIDHDYTPAEVMFKIAKGDFSPEKSIGAMQYLIQREQLADRFVASLRLARNRRVRDRACLCDKAAGVNELVVALTGLISKSPDGTGVLGFEVVDIIEVKGLLGKFQGSKIKEVLAELRDENPELAEALLFRARSVQDTE